jgi:AcrR family transcriptional regulator
MKTLKMKPRDNAPQSKKQEMKTKMKLVKPEEKKPIQGKTRLEKSELTRDALLAAAAEVVGEVGYANASIALITQKAGLGQGTFYNYFDSRQEILDELLPSMGKNMLAFIRKSALGGHSFAELEEGSFLAFFSFLNENSQFLRILNGAEMFAPQGHKKHFDTVSKQYMRFLRHSLQNGEFPAYRDDELEVIVYMLMAARSYLAMRYMFDDGRKNELPEAVTQTYMKFVRYGLEGVPPQNPGADAKKRKKKNQSNR